MSKIIMPKVCTFPKEIIQDLESSLLSKQKQITCKEELPNEASNQIERLAWDLQGHSLLWLATIEAIKGIHAMQFIKSNAEDIGTPIYRLFSNSYPTQIVPIAPIIIRTNPSKELQTNKIKLQTEENALKIHKKIPHENYNIGQLLEYIHFFLLKPYIDNPAKLYPHLPKEYQQCTSKNKPLFNKYAKLGQWLPKMNFHDIDFRKKNGDNEIVKKIHTICPFYDADANVARFVFYCAYNLLKIGKMPIGKPILKFITPN